MSRKQRRDHHPTPVTRSIPPLCACGEPLDQVETVGYDRSKPVAQRRTVTRYWRHRRRWHKKPAA